MKPLTYFVQAGDFVKIGRSGNPQKRIAALQTAMPQRLEALNVCEIPEKEAHAEAGRLARRTSGEWFEATDALLEWIGTLPTVEIDCDTDTSDRWKSRASENQPIPSLRLPEWAEGLPQSIIDCVRQEAMHRGLPSRELVREWTTENARKLLRENSFLYSQPTEVRP